MNLHPNIKVRLSYILTPKHDPIFQLFDSNNLIIGLALGLMMWLYVKDVNYQSIW